MKTQFTPASLISAISTLFRQNNYDVEGPIKIHGAEVDLKATSKADIFAPPVFIEATVEFVDNDKYGKDLTKFVLLREKHPDSKLLCISGEGFTANVQERARESRVEALTYQQLFDRFQRFSPFLRKVKENSELTDLCDLYQEALFEDPIGKEKATAFLSDWRRNLSHPNPWIVVIGDYGSGKTTLTKVLLRRWAEECLETPALAIPFRIELREFTRQFDARTLLHRFLDDNSLSYLSVDFVFSLIRQGRIVLLLDGYDEMAQFMHARERRACLGALAELARDGARGVITSRPNYFTVTEELNLLDALYASLSSRSRFARGSDTVIEREKALDALLQTQFIDRYERSLRDLDENQTRNLVRAALKSDLEGQKAVLDILEMAFRLTDEGASVSLSGKPVIVSYLLEVVEELKRAKQESSDTEYRSSKRMSEWDIYELIVDKLMWRDYNRAPDIDPTKRRDFLKALAIELCKRQSATIDESDFLDLVRKAFGVELRKTPSEQKEQELQRFFADLRSSATLTRTARGDTSGWRFSHNSLREYLATEHLVSSLKERSIKGTRTKVSDAMQKFARSLPTNDVEELIAALFDLTKDGAHGEIVGQNLALVFEAGLRLFTEQGSRDPVGALMARVGGDPCILRHLQLSRCSFASGGTRANLRSADFKGSTFTDVDFSRTDLEGADFSEALLEGVSFRDTRLRNADFQKAMLIEVDFTGADIKDANFNNLSGCSGIRTVTGCWEGDEAIGCFAFNGAKTSQIQSLAICRHHPAWAIAEKIARKLCEGSSRQVLGLVQKGTAARDPKEAERFLKYLVQHGLAERLGGRKDLVKLTDLGRPVLKAFYEGARLDVALFAFFGINDK